MVAFVGAPFLSTTSISRINRFGRVVSLQGLTTNNYSIAAVSQLTDRSQQVSWRGQLMPSQLADLKSGDRSEPD